MEFLDFTAFIGRRESDGLLSDSFVIPWILAKWIPGQSMDDDLSMYLMGGEL